MAGQNLIQEAALMLRRLAESTPTNSDQLSQWYERSREFQAFLKAHPAICNAMPHFVHHYLADADIRAREPEYRADQQDQILGIISEFEAGRIPPDAI
jgi:hypothetical protein